MVIPMRNILVAILALVSFARAEETVRVYVSLDREHSERILKLFEQETGIKVDATYDTEATKTVGPVRQLIEEKGDPQADVYWNNELATTIKLNEHGVLEPYRSPSAEGIPAEFRDREGYWTGFAARARILIVNTKRVKPEEMPASMWDLTDPKWRGQVCMARPQTGTTAAHAAALYVLDETRADEYFDKLVANDLVWLNGNAHCMREVSAGRFSFGWTDTDDYNVARLKGLPVAAVYPDHDADGVGVMYIPNSLMLIRGGPSPANGKKLIDWLLRPEVEEMLAQSATAQIPVRPGVPVPENVRRPDQIGKVMPVDWTRVGKEYDKWVSHVRTKLAKAEGSSPTLYWILAIVAFVSVLGGVFLKRATAEPA